MKVPEILEILKVSKERDYPICITAGTLIIGRGWSIRLPRDDSRKNLEGETTSAFYSHTLETCSVNTEALINRVVRRAAIAVRTMPNAGGLSIVSEIMSAEILGVIYGMWDIRTEMEIVYLFEGWKMVDFTMLMLCGGEPQRIGVSVTRAMGFPTEAEFVEENAARLLEKKINGLVLARNGVDDGDSFYKVILHVFAQSQRIANLLKAYFDVMHWEIKDNVVLICTITDCREIYDNAYQYV
jgi:hypothetical protein